jgi:hypothetical protein
VIRALDVDSLLQLEAELCRAWKRTAFWPKGKESPIAPLGKLVGELITRRRLSPVDADRELLQVLDRQLLGLKQSAFKVFRSGSSTSVTGRAQAEWIRRARTCLHVLLEGTESTDSDPVRRRVFERIEEFFFPTDEATLLSSTARV